MVKCKENYVGKKFGHLTVIKQVEDYIKPSGKRDPKFLCRCDCNDTNSNYVEVDLYSLKSGHSTSCGCVGKKQLKNNDTLVLNLQDENHKLFGKCKTNNTNNWFYFSMSDYDIIKDYAWSEHIDKGGYHSLKTHKNGKYFKMHRLFNMYNPDHINRNPLDNRRENLDVESTQYIQAQNQKLSKNNNSGCKGVCWYKITNKWMAAITSKNKQINLGYYSDLSDAIIARLKAEQLYFDKRAWQIDLMKKYNLLKEGDIG